MKPKDLLLMYVGGLVCSLEENGAARPRSSIVLIRAGVCFTRTGTKKGANSHMTAMLQSNAVGSTACFRCCSICKQMQTLKYRTCMQILHKLQEECGLCDPAPWCARAGVHQCMHACMHACMQACVRGLVDGCAQGCASYALGGCCMLPPSMLKCYLVLMSSCSAPSPRRRHNAG